MWKGNIAGPPVCDPELPEPGLPVGQTSLCPIAPPGPSEPGSDAEHLIRKHLTVSSTSLKPKALQARCGHLHL